MVVEKKAWYREFLTPQSLMGIGVLIGGAITFGFAIKDNIKDTKQNKIEIENKVDQADFNALSERVNRQYEQHNKVVERVNLLEKASEYERGKHDGAEEAIKKLMK